MKRKMKHVKFKGIVTPDVRPLHQREKKMNTRKGIRKGITKDHEVWKVLSLPLFGNPYDTEPLEFPVLKDKRKIKTRLHKLNPVKTEDDDDMEPDYIKKYKKIMK